MITQERLADLLAAIGNHEAKALFFLAMDDAVPYGVTSAHRRFLEIQGSPPVFRGQIGAAQKHIVHSYAPIGLVVREQNESGFLRHVREDPDNVAAALAGFLLAATADSRISLQRLLGKTPASVGVERSPIRRFRVLKALAATEGDTYPTALAETAAVRDTTVAQTLGVYAEHGLLTYSTEQTYQMKTLYRITKPLPRLSGKGRYETTNEIADFLNDLLAASAGELVVPREQIETHLRSLPQWAATESLRDVVQKILKRLADQGRVEIVTSHFGSTHAIVSMTGVQQAWIAQIVNGVSAIAAGDARAIAAGKGAGERILADQDAVRALMRKGFAASKLASGGMSAGNKLRLTAEAVAKLPGATTDELMGIIDSRFSIELLRASLGALAKDGQITGVKQPDGPYRRWYPVER